MCIGAVTPLKLGPQTAPFPMAKSDLFSKIYVEKFPCAFMFLNEETQNQFFKAIKKWRPLNERELWIFKIAVSLK